MDTILQDTLDGLNPKQFNLNPGRVSAIRMTFEGTAKTGQTGTLDDLGSIIVTLRDDQIANVSIRQLANMLDIDRGSNLFSSVTAGAFVASATLDFLFRNDVTMLNALDVRRQNELNFEYVPASTVGTVFDSLSVKVYEEKSAYPERYTLRTLRDNQNEDAAVASKSYPLNKANIANIFLEDPDDVISLVQLSQSERTVLSPSSWTILEAITIGTNQIEDNASDMIKIPTATAGNPESYQNYDTVLYLTTSGAGKIPIVTQSVVWGTGPGQ